MKVAVFYGANEALKLENYDTPTVSPDEVLIKVAACGVCHADLHIMAGTMPLAIEGRKTVAPPMILGHEISGTIEQVGSNLRSCFRTGERVIVGTRYKCGICRYCLAGRDNLCSNRPSPSPVKRKDGTAINRWNVGGFAEYVSVPGYMVFRIPDQLPLEVASIIGCRVTTAYNAVKHGAKLAPGDSALVIGCGGVGLNTVQFLRCFGAYPVIAVDVNDAKLEAARRFGATHTINARAEDPIRVTKSLTGGGVDKAFEAVGNTDVADQIIRATRPGGTSVISGGLRGVPLTISDISFAINEISVTGVASRRATDVVDVLRMIENGRLEITGLVNSKYQAESINTAFADLAKGDILMGVTLWDQNG